MTRLRRSFRIHRAFGIPLADAPANDGLLRSGHADKNVLIALGDLVLFRIFLFFRNEGHASSSSKRSVRMKLFTHARTAALKTELERRFPDMFAETANHGV
jgi:hypothetical protein